MLVGLLRCGRATYGEVGHPGGRRLITFGVELRRTNLRMGLQRSENGEVGTTYNRLMDSCGGKGSTPASSSPRGVSPIVRGLSSGGTSAAEKVEGRGHRPFTGRGTGEGHGGGW